MTEVNNGIHYRQLLFTHFLGKVNVLTYLDMGGMHNKMLTYNLCGLDVPLNDQFNWFQGLGVGVLRDCEQVSIC